MKSAVPFDGDSVPIGRRDEFGAQLRVVYVQGVSLIVLRRHGRLQAAINRCPHAGRRLDDAALKGWKLTCKGHGLTWDLRPQRHPALVTLDHVRIGETDDGEVVIARADLEAYVASRRPPCEADGRVDL